MSDEDIQGPIFTAGPMFEVLFNPDGSYTIIPWVDDPTRVDSTVRIVSITNNTIVLDTDP